jgi:hypothetical protein
MDINKNKNMNITSDKIYILVDILEPLVKDDIHTNRIFQSECLTKTEESEVLWILYYHYSKQFTFISSNNIEINDYAIRITDIKEDCGKWIYTFSNMQVYIPQAKKLIKFGIHNYKMGANIGAIIRSKDGKWKLERDSITDEIYICFTIRNDVNSALVIVKIDPYNFKDISIKKVIHTSPREIVREDPRFFIYENRLFLSYSLLDDPKEKVYVAVSELSDSLDVIREIVPPFGNNLSEQTSAWEKNWVFFEQDKRLFCIYYPSPLIILEFNPETFKVINIIRNNYYENINCNKVFLSNTPPVFLDNKWHFFAHGPYEYNIYQLCFDKDFKMTNISLKPIYTKSENTVYYPCNAILDNIRKQWMLFGGWADRYPCMYTMPLVSDSLLSIH